MFTRWGAFVYRFRRPVALLSLSSWPSPRRAWRRRRRRSLSSGGWLDATSESADVSARLDTEFGAGKSAVIALFRSDDARGRRDVPGVPGRDRDRRRRASPTTRG